MTLKETFDEAYRQSQPKLIRDAMALNDASRGPRFRELAARGYVIDEAIMVGRWDPYDTMLERVNGGFTWIPSGLQANIVIMPGLDFPGQASYDAANPPPGSLKVSIDPKDFPAAEDLYVKDKPFGYRAQAAPGEDSGGVGASYWPSTYPDLDAFDYGSIFKDGEKVYVKREIRTAFGAYGLWVRTV